MPEIKAIDRTRTDVKVDLECVHCGAWDCKTEHKLEKHWTEYPCFYVTVVDGTRYGILAGPFKTHPEALAMVGLTRREAEEVDSRAAWYSFGTAKLPHGKNDGVLNERLTISVNREDT